ncbi:hypothetical protein POJ06DRAFT_249728 [Lipomyces tetrasporus]|uniref:WD40 repeat-like protein n=1 Tax=Lipomyces tetrasporus TaxID=54092 RepID=A0AAD7QT55_9ASCO|nr:uncharacterized protein POJ06DRAFT_249728 [Lipomyces tetrasporus]KAJ8100876.1 hypothetical protein POJ06DRAFT_249728 [Lipomyces tetrasporus]
MADPRGHVPSTGSSAVGEISKHNGGPKSSRNSTVKPKNKPGRQGQVNGRSNMKTASSTAKKISKKRKKKRRAVDNIDPNDANTVVIKMKADEIYSDQEFSSDNDIVILENGKTMLRGDASSSSILAARGPDDEYSSDEEGQPTMKAGNGTKRALDSESDDETQTQVQKRSATSLPWVDYRDLPQKKEKWYDRPEKHASYHHEWGGHERGRSDRERDWYRPQAMYDKSTPAYDDLQDRRQYSPPYTDNYRRDRHDDYYEKDSTDYSPDKHEIRYRQYVPIPRRTYTESFQPTPTNHRPPLPEQPADYRHDYPPLRYRSRSRSNSPDRSTNISGQQVLRPLRPPIDRSSDTYLRNGRSRSPESARGDLYRRLSSADRERDENRQGLAMIRPDGVKPAPERPLRPSVDRASQNLLSKDQTAELPVPRNLPKASSPSAPQSPAALQSRPPVLMTPSQKHAVNVGAAQASSFSHPAKAYLESSSQVPLSQKLPSITTSIHQHASNVDNAESSNASEPVRTTTWAAPQAPSASPRQSVIDTTRSLQRAVTIRNGEVSNVEPPVKAFEALLSSERPNEPAPIPTDVKVSPQPPEKNRLPTISRTAEVVVPSSPSSSQSSASVPRIPAIPLLSESPSGSANDERIARPLQKGNMQQVNISTVPPTNNTGGQTNLTSSAKIQPVKPAVRRTTSVHPVPLPLRHDAASVASATSLTQKLEVTSVPDWQRQAAGCMPVEPNGMGPAKPEVDQDEVDNREITCLLGEHSADFEEYDLYDETTDMVNVHRTINLDAFDNQRARAEIHAHRPRASIDPRTLQGLRLLVEPTVRRPYMSKRARKFLRAVGAWPGFKDYEGAVVHVDFSPWEHQQVLRLIYGLSDSTDAIDVQLDTLLSSLSGRTPADIVGYITDRCELAHRPTYMQLTECKVRPVCRSIPLLASREMRYGRTPQYSLADDALSHLRLIRECHRGSGDTMSITFSSDGKYFAAGNVASEDDYNRSGNLLLGDFTRNRIWALDKHRHKAPGLQEVIYSSVPAAKFSTMNSRTLYTGGYDGIVRSWNASTRTVNDSAVIKARVEMIKTGVVNNSELVAAGTSEGMAYILKVKDDSQGFHNPLLITPIVTKMPAVTCMDFVGSNSNKLVIGYDTDEGAVHNGFGLIYDVASNSKSKLSMSMPYSDIYCHPTLPYFAMSLLNRTLYEGRGGTTFRVFDFNHATARTPKVMASMTTPQLDINKVTMSPDMIYGTTSGTDGSTYVFDLRFCATHLFRLCHGPTKSALDANDDVELQDTGVEVALWVPNHRHHFVTASSDGCLKLWDIRTGTLMKDLLEIPNAIMSAEFTPDGDQILVGDSTGALYQLAHTGPSNGPVEYYDVIENVGGSDRHVTGHDASEELIRRRVARVVTNEFGQRSVWHY